MNFGMTAQKKLKINKSDGGLGREIFVGSEIDLNIPGKNGVR